jgi:hypothetical protein
MEQTDLRTRRTLGLLVANRVEPADTSDRRPRSVVLTDWPSIITTEGQAAPSGMTTGLLVEHSM